MSGAPRDARHREAVRCHRRAGRCRSRRGAGEVCGLVGENGAGKSTLMAILSGALQPDAGEMLLDGQPYAPRDPMAARRAGVAMIYQELSLAPDLSVADNILLGMEPARFGVVRARGDEQDCGRRARRARTSRHRAGSAASAICPWPISSSSKSRRAIAVGCRVLVLDEPTSTLGRRDVERLFALIARLKANGHSIVYISHFIEEVREVCDRIVVLRDGRVAGGGPSTMAPGGDRAVDGRTRRDGSVSAHATASRAKRSAARSTSRLTRRRPRSRLHRGEILGIAGLVGAGRTELLRAIFALDPVRSGRVRVGAYSGGSSPHRAMAAGRRHGQRRSQGRRRRARPRHRRQPDADQARGHGTGVAGDARGNSARSRHAGFAISRSSAPRRRNPWPNCPAATSRRSRSRACFITTSTCCSSTNRRAASMWRARRRSTRSSMRLVAAAQPAGRAPKAVLLVSSYLPELLGLCDRIAVMRRGQLGEAAPGQRMERAHLDAGGHRFRERRRSNAAHPERRGRSDSRAVLRRGDLRHPDRRALLSPRQSRADRAADRHRRGRRARHDGDHRVGRHRSLGRLGRRADDRRDRVVARPGMVAAVGRARRRRRRPPSAGSSTAC